MTILDAESRAAIAEILGRYCHAIDRRRWELIEGCFHDDAVYTFSQIDGSWRNFVAAARHMVDPLPMTHHQLGQTVHAIDGADIVTETYFTAIHLVPAQAAREGVFDGRGHDYHAVMAGRYIDRFTRRGGEWRIARRIGVLEARHDLIPTGDAPPAPGSADPAWSVIG